MTNREQYIVDFILKFEGGYAGNIDGQICTMKGITLNTYKAFYGKNKDCSDLKKITDEEWLYIFKKGFYDRIKGDEIKNDSLCLLIVDWCWMSGVKTAIRKVQSAIGVKSDGVVGPKTLYALNSIPREAFDKIFGRREYFYQRLVEKNPENKKYIKGWLRRLRSIEFKQP